MGNLKRALIPIEQNQGLGRVSKQLAGTIDVSNKVSIVSDSDPFVDGSQVFKYELDGNTLDTDQVTPVDGTPTNITYDYEGQKFGTAQAVFDGTAFITGTASINSNAFSYSTVVTTDTVDVAYKYLFAMSNMVISNGSATNKNLWFRDGTSTWLDLGYSLTVGKQETVEINVNNTVLELYIDGLLVSSHTIASTIIDGIFSIGSNTGGTSSFYKGKLDQPEVYNRATTAGESESLYFQEITRADNLITTTDVEVAYHNGYNLGAVNTAEALTNPTIEALTPSAINFGYVNEGSNTISWTVDEPVYGKNNKRTSAINPDIIDEGFTFSSSNGAELATNGTFDTDIVGVSAIDAVTLSWEAGTLKLTSTGASGRFAKYSLPTEIGKKYRAMGYVVNADSVGGTYLSLTSDDGLITYGILNNAGVLLPYIDFIAETTTTDFRFTTSGTATESSNFDNLTLFETDIKKDTAYVTPRTYLNTKIEADSAGKPALASEWIGATLVERRVVAEKAEINDLVVKDGFSLNQDEIILTAERVLGVEYLNDTKKPINVGLIVSGTNTTVYGRIYVDDILRAYSRNSDTASGSTFITVQIEVKPNSTYKCEAVGTVSSWIENR